MSQGQGRANRNKARQQHRRWFRKAKPGKKLNYTGYLWKGEQ